MFPLLFSFYGWECTSKVKILDLLINKYKKFLNAYLKINSQQDCFYQSGTNLDVVHKLYKLC